MTTDKALQSIVNEVKRFIYRREGKYANSVIADFNDAIRQSDNPHKTAYQWLQDYKKHGKRAERVEGKPKVATAPKAETPKYPKRASSEWTAYKPKGNKFVEMWEYSNILTRPEYRNASPKQVQKLLKRKLDTLEKMAARVDNETREHFRMVLTEVLRVEQNQDIRREVIYMLARHFGWSEIEWTFWLHGNHRSEDHYILIVAEARCISRNMKGIEKAASDETRLLLVESIR